MPYIFGYGSLQSRCLFDTVGAVCMQVGQYLTATRGYSLREARLCYERVESLCHSLNRPLLLYGALTGQWRYSLFTDKLTATMQIAKRVHSLAKEYNDSALMIRAYRALAVTLYFLGAFESARQYAMSGVEIWRSEGVPSHVEEVTAPAVVCLCYQGLSEWHIGETTSCHATMSEAISLAKEVNDMHALALALWHVGWLAHFERIPVEVERLASDVIELSTRHNFAFWLAAGEILRGWSRSASGHTAEGISWIEKGIEDLQTIGSIRIMPYWLALKAEALHLADRSSEALEAIRWAEVLAERSDERFWCAELYRLRGVFLATLGAEETQIEASFRAAISTAREQKSISLAERAEATFAEYRLRKAEALGDHGFRLPLH